MNTSGQLLSLLDNRLDAVTLLFGLLMFAGGIVMMFQHLRQWRQVENHNVNDDQLRRFEWYKFRRRTLVGALVAGCGAIITSLASSGDAYLKLTLITILVLFLVLILVLATIDLMSVGVFQFSRPDRNKQKAIVDEILRQRKLKQLNDPVPDQEAGKADS